MTTVGGDRTSYTDTDVEPDSTYYYRVIARGSDASESPPSFAASSTTPELEDEFPWIWILMVIVIIVLILLISLVATRRKQEEAPSPQPKEKKELPSPPPGWTSEKEYPQTSEEKERPHIIEEEIPEFPGEENIEDFEHDALAQYEGVDFYLDEDANVWDENMTFVGKYDAENDVVAIQADYEPEE